MVADLSGDVLADGEDVGVGVFEPGDFGAVGGGPDAKGLVLGKGIFFRGDAAVAEPGGYGLDVLDFPAEDGALERGEVGDFCDANCVATDAHDQGELIEAHELEAEFAFVEGAGFVVVGCGMKPTSFADASIGGLLSVS
jgi:hypothetical protein